MKLSQVKETILLSKINFKGITIRRNKPTVVLGPTNSYKSSFLIGLAGSLIKEGNIVTYFDFDNPEVSTATKILANLTEIPFRVLNQLEGMKKNQSKVDKCSAKYDDKLVLNLGSIFFNFKDSEYKHSNNIKVLEESLVRAIKGKSDYFFIDDLGKLVSEYSGQYYNNYQDFIKLFAKYSKDITIVFTTPLNKRGEIPNYIQSNIHGGELGLAFVHFSEATNNKKTWKHYVHTIDETRGVVCDRDVYKFDFKA